MESRLEKIFSIGINSMSFYRRGHPLSLIFAYFRYYKICSIKITSQCKILMVLEEGWFGQPKYSTHKKIIIRCVGFCFYFLHWLVIFTQEAPLTRKWFSRRSCIRSNWNLKMLLFEARGKPDNPVKNLSEQSKEPSNNLTRAWQRILNRTRAT